MGWLILWIVLVAAWLKMAAWTSLLMRVRPWKILSPSLQPYQRLLVKLERVKSGFQLLNWLFMILTVGLTVFFVGRNDGLPIGLVLAIVIALAVVGCSYLESLQLLLLKMAQKTLGRYGTKLGFIFSFVRFCAMLGSHLFPEGPLWHDEKEMASFVEYHQRRYKQASDSAGKQLVSLVKIDERKVGQLTVNLKDALLIRGEEVVGPILLKELHDSKYSVFGVYEERRTHLVGILEQGVALSHAARNVKVSSLIDEHIVYLTPDTTYRAALSTFMETNTTLAAIVDGNSKPIGVLYLRDILGRLFGE